MLAKHAIHLENAAKIAKTGSAAMAKQTAELKARRDGARVTRTRLRAHSFAAKHAQLSFKARSRPRLGNK